MKITTQSSADRSGFTLVELLVSMALTLFIMTILVEAFGAGMDTFQNMRALGDVQDSLRSGLNLLKADLGQDHFEGGRKTNDTNFWEEPRREGFVFIEQGSKVNSSTKYVDEGTDLDLITKSYLATDHRLSFSMRLRGNRRDNFAFEMNPSPGILLGKRLNATNAALETGYSYDSFAPTSAPKDYPAVTSQWLEVGYFLGAPQGAFVPPPSIPFTDPKNPNAPNPPAYGPIYLYNLYRAAALTVPYADDLNKQNVNAMPYLRMSRNVATGKFLSPNDLAKGPASRTALYDLTKPMSAPENAAVALVCTNVVSFQIRVLKDPPTAGAVGYEDLVTATGNLEAYDSATRPASGYRLLGLQIILRVYDPSSGLTRQATLNHDF